MTQTRYSARDAREAAETVRLIHTYVVRGAARLMAKDHRIRAAGAVVAMTGGYFDRLEAARPAVMATYRRALEALGIGPGDMDYQRFMSFVPAGDRLRLTEDRKVAGRAA